MVAVVGGVAAVMLALVLVLVVAKLRDASIRVSPSGAAGQAGWTGCSGSAGIMASCVSHPWWNIQDRRQSSLAATARRFKCQCGTCPWGWAACSRSAGIMASCVGHPWWNLEDRR